MKTTIGSITFGAIKNVHKSGDEDGVYFADVEIQGAEGFPLETFLYCARADDYAITGKWVYQQITAGNIEGVVTQLAPSTALETSQSATQGAQTW
jgi:hypothetical protein